MAARWYNPATGGFDSRDGIALPASPSGRANRYTYALGAPLSHVDPTGHDSIDTACQLGSLHGVRVPSSFWDGALSFIGIPVDMVCNAPSTASGCDDVLYLPDGTPCGPIAWEWQRQILAEDELDAERRRKRNQWPITSPPPAQCGAVVLGARDCSGQPPGKPLPPGKPKPVEPPPDPAIKARKDNEDYARKHPFDPWPDLWMPAFAGAGTLISSAASVAASAVGALATVVTDGAAIWTAFRDTLVDLAKPIVRNVDRTTDKPEIDPGRIPRPLPLPDDDPGGKTRPRGAPRNCTTNWRTYDPMETVIWQGRPGDRATDAQACAVTTNRGAPRPTPPRPFGYEKYQGMARCHLIAHMLHGSNTDRANFVPCYQDVTNNSWMYHQVESRIAAQVDGGNPVFMDVTPFYSGQNPVPSGISVVAVGNNGWSCAVLIPNVTRQQRDNGNVQFNGC
ncbi:hypothetical protein F0L68_17220 [Solihabitans fulvus]|uniref:Type VII secretion system protein EssD-like domain-containing protein n=1 Tax=Solihabitans fulvus TaxID=1892852 RepID=A0A5B2XDT7_9PSEU|nr:DNA/RNA non-specific endonuclease [Solihabitans fulvus]KAA2261513.1 hypothetical protein F0L68_17220 [Solihabitans fulvus]